MASRAQTRNIATGCHSFWTGCMRTLSAYTFTEVSVSRCSTLPSSQPLLRLLLVAAGRTIFFDRFGGNGGLGLGSLQVFSDNCCLVTRKAFEGLGYLLRSLAIWWLLLLLFLHSGILGFGGRSPLRGFLFGCADGFWDASGTVSESVRRRLISTTTTTTATAALAPPPSLRLLLHTRTTSLTTPLPITTPHSTETGRQALGLSSKTYPRSQMLSVLRLAGSLVALFRTFGVPVLGFRACHCCQSCRGSIGGKFGKTRCGSCARQQSG